MLLCFIEHLFRRVRRYTTSSSSKHGFSCGVVVVKVSQCGRPPYFCAIDSNCLPYNSNSLAGPDTLVVPNTMLLMTQMSFKKLKLYSIGNALLQSLFLNKILFGAISAEMPNADN